MHTTRMTWWKSEFMTCIIGIVSIIEQKRENSVIYKHQHIVYETTTDSNYSHVICPRDEVITIFFFINHGLWLADEIFFFLVLYVCL